MSDYVSFSGGADSTAVALLLWQQGKDFELVFADTGAELPETLWFIPRFARQIGKKLTVVSNGSFFQHLVNYEFLLPSPHIRWCTGQLKCKPLDHFCCPDDLMYIGIRADENSRISAKEGKKYEVVFPLMDAGMDKKAAIALCKKHDALNPIYSWRSSCSCFCCMFQPIRDWRGLYKHHAEMFALAEEWEHLSMQCRDGFTWRKGHTLKNLRQAQETQLCLFPEPEDEPCLICQA